MEFPVILSWPGGARSFSVNSNLTVLEQALAAGVPVPNSCQRGDCGQCVAEVVMPEGVHTTAENSVHLCSTRAVAPHEYRLKVDPFRAAERIRNYPAKIRAIDYVTSDVVRLIIVTPPNKLVEFSGGQFARLTVADGLTRDYSIASVDPTSREIAFFIRLLEGGQFSKWLTERAAVGQLLQIRAPMGCFEIQNESVNRSWFVATGTGIVPIYSLLSGMTEEQSLLCGQKTLLWGNRYEEDLFLRDELRVVCESHNITLQFVFSRDERYPKNRVTDFFDKQEWAESAVYVAGFSEMVCDVRKLALDRGLSENYFHADIF